MDIGGAGTLEANLISGDGEGSLPPSLSIIGSIGHAHGRVGVDAVSASIEELREEYGGSGVSSISHDDGAKHGSGTVGGRIDNLSANHEGGRNTEEAYEEKQRTSMPSDNSESFFLYKSRDDNPDRDIDEAENQHKERLQADGNYADIIPLEKPNHSQVHMRHVEYLFSIRGWDNFHIYLWILKDLAWTLDNFWMSAVCGTMAVAWCGILVIVAYRNGDWEEIYMLVSTILWIVGNFWWMAAETNIVGDDDTHALQTSYMLETGLGWLVLFYLVLRPLNVIRETPAVTEQFLILDLHSRFSYFKNWRQYEYLHMLFWISKDLSWNRLFKPTWWIAFVMTTLLGVEFIWVSYKKGYVVDVAHYVAQLFWVLANGAWAYGELYTDFDDPYPLGDANPNAVKTGRWWGSVLLVIAFIPILILYFLWFPYMYLKAQESKDDLRGPTLRAVFFDPRSASLDHPISEDVPSHSDIRIVNEGNSEVEEPMENPVRKGTL